MSDRYGAGSRSAAAACVGGRWRARGQALVLAMIALLVLCVGVIVLFDTGIAVNKKTQLVNTADAAAYSVAVQQARAFNTIAYLNRAQVANEISMAQVVSMYSWMGYIQSGTDHMAKALEVIGVVTSEIGIGEILLEAGQIMDRMKSAIKQVRAGLKPVLEGVVDTLSAANKLYVGAEGIVARDAYVDSEVVADRVVKANAADASGRAGYGNEQMRVSDVSRLALVAQAHAAARYVREYHSMKLNPQGRRESGFRRADADRYVNVVMEARDPFTRGHHDSYFGIFDESEGTDMVDYSRWVGVDTFNFDLPGWLSWIPGAPDNVPLAWAAAAAVRRNTRARASIYLWGIDNGRGWTSPYDLDHHRHDKAYQGALGNGMAGELVANDPADAEGGGKASDALLKGYTGLQNYYDVVDNKHANLPYRPDGDYGVDDKAYGPIFTVQVEQPVASVHTSAKLGIGAGRMRQVDSADNGAISALASAQVYFSRPRDRWPFARQIDDRRELGNLFSPYWQARLVDTPESIRLGFKAGSVVIP